MMEWVPCTECIYVDEDCVETRRADGCYCGEREEKSIINKYSGEIEIKYNKKSFLK